MDVEHRTAAADGRERQSARNKNLNSQQWAFLRAAAGAGHRRCGRKKMKYRSIFLVKW